MIVIDASAAAELLMGTAAGAHVVDRVSRPGESLHAPHVFDLEILSALQRQLRAGAMTADRAEEALGSLADLRISRWPHQILVRRIWQLRANATAYDAAYLSLAELLDAPLLTRDRKLGGIPGHNAQVEVI